MTWNGHFLFSTTLTFRHAAIFLGFGHVKGYLLHHSTYSFFVNNYLPGKYQIEIPPCNEKFVKMVNIPLRCLIIKQNKTM